MTDLTLSPSSRLPLVGLPFWLALALGLSVLLSLSLGAAGVGPLRLWAALTGAALTPAESVVLYDIRLPRVAMGIVVGAGLAVSGAVLQGLFRNPLADPGVIGVTSGASLGAVAAIVLGGMLPLGLAAWFGLFLIPAAACLGGWVFTLVLYRFASRQGRTQVATLLLAGIALGALAASVMGVLIYLADDRQLRDLTFWSMGSLAGATWGKFMIVLPLVALALVTALRLGRGLNALSLGEAQALHLGIEVQRLKRMGIVAAALATGATVSVSGGIGFVGIIVPHLLRRAIGPDHRRLLPCSALLGAALLVAADILSRLVVAPAELPIGIITALLGAPVFLWILLHRQPGAGF